jgi:hypothetical protein
VASAGSERNGREDLRHFGVGHLKLHGGANASRAGNGHLLTEQWRLSAGELASRWRGQPSICIARLDAAADRRACGSGSMAR